MIYDNLNQFHHQRMARCVGLSEANTPMLPGAPPLLTLLAPKRSKNRIWRLKNTLNTFNKLRGPLLLKVCCLLPGAGIFQTRILACDVHVGNYIAVGTDCINFIGSRVVLS